MSELSEAELDALVAQATVDCCNEDEELARFAVMIEDNLALRCLGERGFALLTGRWRAPTSTPPQAPAKSAPSPAPPSSSPISSTATSHEFR